MMKADRLTAEELRALDAYEQASLLNDLFGEVGRLGRLKQEVINALYDAKILLIQEKTDESKVTLERAKKAKDNVDAEIAYRKEQVKILQTLLRVTPG
jgi:hypothetical protein